MTPSAQTLRCPLVGDTLPVISTQRPEIIAEEAEQADSYCQPRVDEAARISAMRLCYAAASNNVKELSALVEGRADVNVCDYNGQTPLHVAAGLGSDDVAKALIVLKADVNAMDRFNQSPLGEAERQQHFNVEHCLKAHGAHTLLENVRSAATGERWILNRSEVTLRFHLAETIKSKVYKADWRGLEVVAKLAKPSVISEGNAEEPPDQNEMLHEIGILATLRHPDLVMFLGACLNETPIMIVSEYMPGGDLENYYINKRKEIQGIYRPRADQLLRWCSDVARALCFLHNCHPTIVHRDLKPLNLLMTKDHKSIKVSDFGISTLKKLDRVACSSSVVSYRMTGGVGSWRYMAPEVVRYQNYNENVDIFSFGLIMYFMSAGREPFHELGKDPEIVLKEYIKGNEPRPKPAECHKFLRPIMASAWHIEHTARPSAHEILHFLTGLHTTQTCCPTS